MTDLLTLYPDADRGYIGDLINGVIDVPGKTNTLYVTLRNGYRVEALNIRVSTPTLRLSVLAGYDPGNLPATYQVLGALDTSSAVAPNKHHKSHEMFSGDDVTYIRGEQFYPSLYAPVGLTVNIYPATFRTSTGWKTTPLTNMDLSGHLPGAPGNARFVMIIVDSSGSFAIRDGAEVAGWSNLDSNTNMPEPLAGDNCICGVKLYYGQTAIRLDSNNNDFVEMRFSGANPGSTSGETATSIGILINGTSAKTTPVDADLLLIADSAASWVIKKVTGTNLKAYLKTYLDILYDKTATIIHAATTKTVPDDNDELGYLDSAAAYVLKKFTWANIKTALNLLYATISHTHAGIYAAISHSHSGTDITGGTIDGERLPAMSTTRQGSVPATGTVDTTTYLRKDGTWATPAGSGGGDVYGNATVTDGHLAVFDGDGYHIKDGGAVPSGGGSGNIPASFNIYMSTNFH